MKMNLNIQVVVLATLAGVSLFAFDRSSGRVSRKDEPAAAVLARVPQKARSKRNPLETDPDAVQAGKKLFEQHCAECHGNTADGTNRGPSLRTVQLQQATPGELFWIVTNGVVRRGMPAWSKLPEPQRWQIVTFLREYAGLAASTASSDAATQVKNRSTSPEPLMSLVREFGPGDVNDLRRCR